MDGLCRRCWRSGRAALAWAALSGAGLVGCNYELKDKPSSAAPSSELAEGVERVTIEPAPEHLRGRVALLAGARVYSRPTYTSPSWSLVLPDPPLRSADGPPRARAFRVVGVVRASDGSVGGSVTGANQFLAVTNDLVGEDEDAPVGCGAPVAELEHLRMLVYVPAVHLAEVTTRTLELDAFSHGAGAGAERLHVGAGVRVGPPVALAGLPQPEAGSRWRWIDADGIRGLAPIPDEAVGVAWDPGHVPEFDDAGEALMRDAEGSTLWLRDGGGDELELTLRNACAEQRSRAVEPAEVESLRALALDAFYDQRPPAEPPPAVELDADYRIPAGTALRWTDGDLAGELLADWSVAIGVGQTWDNRRCFPLTLGGELEPVDAPALACVDPDALELLSAEAGFGVSDVLALGGSVELGPVEQLEGGPWDEQALRVILNGHHDSAAECLRPLLVASERLEAARWELRLRVGETGRVDEVEIEARGPSHEAVEDCLRAEVFTWLLPEGAAGRLLVPVTLGEWTPELDPAEPEPDAGEPGAGEPDRRPSDPAGPESPPEDPPERGKVIIIPDEEPEPSE